eukprot:EST44393.1 Hypothetical protein SS50377_15696 [Spironucleus salmonicida]
MQLQEKDHEIINLNTQLIAFQEQLEDKQLDYKRLLQENQNLILEIEQKNTNILTLQNEKFEVELTKKIDQTQFMTEPQIQQTSIHLSSLQSPSIVHSPDLNRICEFLNVNISADDVIDHIEKLNYQIDNLTENLNLALDRVKATRDYESAKAVNDVVREVMKEDFSVRVKIRRAIEEKQVVKDIYNSVQ